MFDHAPAPPSCAVLMFVVVAGFSGDVSASPREAASNVTRVVADVAGADDGVADAQDDADSAEVACSAHCALAATNACLQARLHSVSSVECSALCADGAEGDFGVSAECYTSDAPTADDALCRSDCLQQFAFDGREEGVL